MKQPIPFVLVLFVLFLFACMQSVETSTNNATCFTPGQQCTDLIVAQINRAKSSIKVQAYSFTSKPIVEALIEAHHRDVAILVLLDKSNVSSKYSVIHALQTDHIPFLIDARPRIAHNKVMIIDGEQVITGSFNFTEAAQKSNAENVIIIHDPVVASAYLKNFTQREKVSENFESYCQRVTTCPPT